MSLHLNQSASMTWCLKSQITSHIWTLRSPTICRLTWKWTTALSKQQQWWWPNWDATAVSWPCEPNQTYSSQVSLVLCFTIAKRAQHVSGRKNTRKASISAFYNVSSASHGEAKLPTLSDWTKQNPGACIIIFINIDFDGWVTCIVWMMAIYQMIPCMVSW